MFDVLAPAAPVASQGDARHRILAAATRLAACPRRDRLADTIADVLVDLLSASVIGVRIAGASAWRTAGGDRPSTRRVVEVLVSSDLESALAGGLVADLGSLGGAAAALAAGIDAGPDALPGVVVVAGPGLDRELDGDALAAVADLAAAVLAQLDRTARAQAHAETDRATGLLNRLGLERALADATSDGGAFAVVDLHLGGVTELGAAFGAPVARRVVQAVGEQLLALPLVEAVASVAADGLTAVVRGDIAAAADQVVAEASRPVGVGRQSVCLDVRAGAAATTAGGTTREAIDRAALARVQAAASGSAVVVHSAALTAGCHQRLEIAASLRRALDDGGQELVVHYQPQVDADGRVIGLEALVRWRRADGTVVRPDDFLPVAERAGLMAEIDLHVLRTVCRQLSCWSADGVGGFRVAVNLSASTLARPEIFGAVVAVLDDTGVDPRRLELEITETAATDETGWVSTLAQLRSFGVSVAMDDFGTGYSSLGRIHRLPLDRLKIDRSFVADLDGAGAGVAAAVVSLAAGLGMQVLAEGVEHERQVAVLVELGCTEFQGYAFGRPQPAGDIEALLVAGAVR